MCPAESTSSQSNEQGVGQPTSLTDGGAHCHGKCKRWISSFAAPSLVCLFVAWLPSFRSCFGTVLWTVFDTIVDAVFDAGMIVLTSAFRSNALVPLLRPNFCSLQVICSAGSLWQSYWLR